MFSKIDFFSIRDVWNKLAVSRESWLSANGNIICLTQITATFCVSHLISLGLTSFICKIRRLKKIIIAMLIVTNGLEIYDAITKSWKCSAFMMINHFLTAVNVLRKKSKFTGRQWKLVYYMVLFTTEQHKVTKQQLPGNCKPWRLTNPMIWGTGLAFSIDQRNIVSSLSTWTMFATCLKHNSRHLCLL